MPGRLCCRYAGQISQKYGHYNTQSHNFEFKWDLAVKWYFFHRVDYRHGWFLWKSDPGYEGCRTLWQFHYHLFVWCEYKNLKGFTSHMYCMALDVWVWIFCQQVYLDFDKYQDTVIDHVWHCRMGVRAARMEVGDHPGLPTTHSVGPRGLPLREVLVYQACSIVHCNKLRTSELRSKYKAYSDSGLLLV